MPFAGQFDETKHPRNPKGNEGGGRFAELEALLTRNARLRYLGPVTRGSKPYASFELLE